MVLEFATSSPFGGVHGCFENNVNTDDYTDLWVHSPRRKPTTPKHNKPNVVRDKNDGKTRDSIVKDEKKQRNKWSRAREMIFSFEKRQHVEDAQSESSVETHSSIGVSSLVRKWKGLEAVAKSGSTNDDNGTNEEDSLGECESERITISGPPSYRSSPSRDFSDGYETDRIKVSDIIKKLTEEQPNAPENTMPRVRTSLDKSEQRCFSPVVNSPRIRGRQAFNDLLMQMERDRNNELEGLVARRAVSKFSHRGRIQSLLRFKFLRQGMEAKEATHPNGASSDQKHKLLQFYDPNCRKRVNSNVQNSSADIKSCDKNLRDNTPATGKGEENHHQEVTHMKNYPASNLDNVQDEDTEPARALESIDSIFIRISKHIKAKESACQQVVGTKDDITGDYAEEGWEEENSEYRQEEENDNSDWIYEVSRPRSDWEDFRQKRYQEMHYHFMGNEEIRTLLGRKTVSNFLSSDLRNQIDRIMLSRTQGQQISVNERTREERVEETIIEDEEVAAEDGEEEKHDKQQYDERENYDDYCEETSTYSSQVASASPQHSLMSNAYDNRSSTSVAAHPAIEMELMYDLRRHMEQLQQEVVELRKSIRSCVDMQNQLQRSIKPDHSDEKKAGGTCSVCCKMPIDSLLYRCGHMCTCIKCAHELQCSSGKCPVCRAPIMDVVRTYYHS